MDEGDTDLLLALLESLLPSDHETDRETLLEVLIAVDGDASLAAKHLTKPSTSSLSPRRKASSGLDGWVTNSRRKLSPEHGNPASSLASLLTELQSEVPVPSRTNGRGSPSKSVPPLLNFLKDTPSPKKTLPLPRLPVLTLTSSEMIASHTPTTLHPGILPPELACRLYYKMLDESLDWKKNTWYLNDRLVESPHSSAFYARSRESAASKGMEEVATYWYNGIRGTPLVFPQLLEEALEHVEKVVHTEMAKRKRYPLEWGGDNPPLWSGNVAAVNCYRGSKEGVGAHADQLTCLYTSCIDEFLVAPLLESYAQPFLDLGPYPTIASISLGTTRIFRLREVISAADVGTRQAQTFDIPLPHNSLLIMHPPTQEKFKHSIPTVKSIDAFRPAFARGDDVEPMSQVERINITFRFYRHDYRPETIPECLCDGDGGKIPALLRSNMRRRGGKDDADFYWQCNGAAQNQGRSCKMWRPMSAHEEGRGPFVTNLVPR